jgi:hypothetical protein
MKFIDAWWFNNLQEDCNIPQPNFFTPKSHIGVYAELEKIELPFSLLVYAKASDGKILYSNNYNIITSESCEKYEIEIDPQMGIFIFKALTDTLSELPDSIYIVYKDKKTEYAQTKKCEYSTLSGKINDFNGNLFQSPLLLYRVAFDGKNSYMGVWSDKDGKYQITVPNGTYNAFYLDDDSYNKTTLECWGWHMIVDQNEEINFKIGNGEVYSLHTWPSNGGFSTLFIYFRPMILPSLKHSTYTVDLNEGFNVTDISPDLELKDLNISVNNHKCEVISLQRIYETSSDKKSMPAYIVQVNKYCGSIHVGKQTLCVEYNNQKRKDIDKNVILAQSQGYMQFFYKDSCATCIK